MVMPNGEQETQQREAEQREQEQDRTDPQSTETPGENKEPDTDKATQIQLNRPLDAISADIIRRAALQRAASTDDVASQERGDLFVTPESLAGLDGDTLDIDWNPSNYTPDSSISEADDDDDLSAHLKGIDSSLSNVIGVDTTVTTLSGATVQTEHTTTSIPGGTLGSQGGIRIMCQISDFEIFDDEEAQIEIEYGSSSIFFVTQGVVTPGGPNASGTGLIDVTMLANGSTSSQFTMGMAKVMSGGGANVDQDWGISDTRTTSVDSTSSQDIVVRVRLFNGGDFQVTGTIIYRI